MHKQKVNTLRLIIFKALQLILLFSTSLLVGCIGPYQAADKVKTIGYSESLTLDGSLRLQYRGGTSSTANTIKQYWRQRALELCPLGFEVIKHRAYIERGTIRSPVGDIMVNLGTETPVEVGTIRCQSIEEN
jgi:hypothetical protein